MNITLESVTILTIFHFLLIFCRLGALIMMLPGIGEIFVPERIRLTFALVFTYVLFPMLSPKMPDFPESAIRLVLLVLAEILTGAFIGGLARLIQSLLHVAGMIMAFLSSLAAAQLFDSTQGSQGSVFGNFLTLTGITLFLVTDLHHLMLRGIYDSYEVFAPGSFVPVEDFAKLAGTMMSDVFALGFRVAAPILIVGTCLYLAAGVMGRLMPAMQVFFVLVPVQIIVCFNILMISLATGMMVYLNHFEESMTRIFYP